jgi:hypothetical protein
MAKRLKIEKERLKAEKAEQRALKADVEEFKAQLMVRKVRFRSVHNATSD